MTDKVSFDDPLDTKPLMDLVEYFFNWQHLKTCKNEIVGGMTGEDHKFDFLISGGKNNSPLTGNNVGVMVFDYNKHCGTDSVLKADKAGRDCDLGKMMVISNNFSSSAKSMAIRAGILTLSRGELVSILRIHLADIFDA